MVERKSICQYDFEVVRVDHTGVLFSVGSVVYLKRLAERFACLLRRYFGG